MKTGPDPLRGVRGGSGAPPVQPHGVKRGYRTRRQHGGTKRRPRARSRGRDACRAFSLGVRMTRLRDAQGSCTATLSCAAVGPWIRGDAELTEWSPALGLRFGGRLKVRRACRRRARRSMHPRQKPVANRGFTGERSESGATRVRAPCPVRADDARSTTRADDARSSSGAGERSSRVAETCVRME